MKPVMTKERNENEKWTAGSSPVGPRGNMSDIIEHNHDPDGVDRRGFLKCMAWAGTGMLWTVRGGLLGSTLLPARAGAKEVAKGSFSFVQISDPHIGFNKEGINTDLTGTLKQAGARSNPLPQPPDFILHTGDLT